MTTEEYELLAAETWKANRANALKIATGIFARHRLPDTATLLIPNLAALLTELQKASFLHGALAAYYSIGEVK